jgi:hypothetical protein
MPSGPTSDAYVLALDGLKNCQLSSTRLSSTGSVSGQAKSTRKRAKASGSCHEHDDIMPSKQCWFLCECNLESNYKMMEYKTPCVLEKTMKRKP